MLGDGCVLRELKARLREGGGDVLGGERENREHGCPSALDVLGARQDHSIEAVQDELADLEWAKCGPIRSSS